MAYENKGCCSSLNSTLQNLIQEPESKRYEPVYIDLENKNSSHSLIIKMVGSGKRILEIGTSTGYITKILKELNNSIVGIEIDKGAAEIAKQYCESMIVGDVEELDLDEYIEPASIDVILLADVLEHLRWPGSVLDKIKRYLNPDGYLIVSLPNVSHGDLLLNLLNGDFRYTSVGLLDETHIRFFGRRNIIDIFNSHGYDIKDIHTIQVPVGATELKLDFNRITQELLEFIRTLPDSDVYQFVFKAVPSATPSNEPIPDVDFDKALSLCIEDILKKYEIKEIALSEQLQQANAQSAALRQEIDNMRNSIVWRMTTKFHEGFVERALPQGSRLRRWYDLGLEGCRILVNYGPKETILRFEEHRETYKETKILGSNRRLEVANIDLKYKQYIDSLFSKANQKSPEYIPLSQNYINLEESDIKLIAFYLPQYHPIPENDKWWGKGFTDWTNVSKAVPQFIGHYQPHLPDELGFYDLRLIEVQKQQIDLAKRYGIYGFCFHYYWFNGKRLLERPLDQFLNNPELDFPFCICWANENWTRRWDGRDKEVLIAQSYSPEIEIAFIRDLEPIIRDPRYIRIGGRPVIIVYHIKMLPNAKATAERWRAYCKEHGIGDIYLIAAQTFGFRDPRPYGFDAAVEFPPHSMPGCKCITDKVDVINPKFNGQIFDFNSFVINKAYLKTVPYKLFKTLTPGWDNTSRKPYDTTVFHGSNPSNYKELLLDLAIWTKKMHPPDERIMFINAWNEWAEGAHLEPDRKYGYSYLQATSEVIQIYRKLCRK